MKIWFVFLTLFVPFFTVAQTETDEYNFYCETGFTYIPLDYIGGANFGISFTHPQQRLGIALTSNVLFSVMQSQNVNAQNSVYNYYRFDKLYMQTYFDIRYRISAFTAPDLNLAFGIGRINRMRNDFVIPVDNNYPVASISLMYHFKWLDFRLRGDIPIIDYELKKAGVTTVVFPVSVNVIYRFRK